MGCIMCPWLGDSGEGQRKRGGRGRPQASRAPITEVSGGVLGTSRKPAFRLSF